MTKTVPLLRTILHWAHIFLTDARTFIFSSTNYKILQNYDSGNLH